MSKGRTDIFAASERMMGMSDATWTRHANPWSVYSRMTIVPLFVLAVFSRAWLGWWCLVPVALVLFWTWANPRAFPPPADYDNWASLGVLGERWFLARDRVAIPDHHLRATRLLTLVSAAGLIPLAWGLVRLDPGWAAAGTALIVGGKLAFVDRCVWIFLDMTGHVPGSGLAQPHLPPEKRLS